MIEVLTKISTLAAAEEGIAYYCDGLTSVFICEEPAIVDAADGRRLCLDCACCRRGELATPADLNAWHSAVLAVWASFDEDYQ